MAVSSGSLIVKLIFLHYLVMTVGAPDVSIIVSNPRPLVGETVTLICTYSPRSSIKSFNKLEWYRNNTEIANFLCPNNDNNADMCQKNVLDDMDDERLSLEADAVYSGNQTISELRASDNGEYTCAVRTDAQARMGSNTTKLDVRIPGPESIVEAPTEGNTTLSLASDLIRSNHTENLSWTVTTKGPTDPTTTVYSIWSSELLVYILIGSLGLAVLILFIICLRWIHLKIRRCRLARLGRKNHRQEGVAPLALRPVYRRYPASSDKTLEDNAYDSISECNGSLNKPRYHSSLGTDANGYAPVPDPLAAPSAFSRYTVGDKGVIDEYGYMVPSVNITAAK